MAKKDSVLCLFSGGIDSTVMVKHYLDKGWEVHGFFVNYGQNTADQEAYRIRVLAKAFMPPVVIIWQNEVLKPRLWSDGYFFPMRNALLLTYAINWAYGQKIPNVAIGCNHGEYLDQRPEFIDRFNFMQEYCLKEPIWVRAPFSDWSSERVIKYGLKIGAPLDLTTSCMDIPACGTCLKCKLRKKYGIVIQ